MRMLHWLAIPISLATACGGGVGADAGSSPDGGEDAAVDAAPPIDTVFADAPPHNLKEVELRGTGKVSSDPAVGMHVVARCGDKTTETFTDANGSYSLTANVESCAPLVVEFTKESFLPVVKVIPLPPPTSPVTLDVSVLELDELLCTSTDYCVQEDRPGSKIPRHPIESGFVISMNGDAALDFVGGNLVDEKGDILWLTAFAYSDLRDATGATIASLVEATRECYPVNRHAFDWLVDIDPATLGAIEMRVYALDTRTGRWMEKAERATVSLTTDYTEDGDPIITPAPAAQLGDIRADVVDDAVWLCAHIGGSGWMAFGHEVEQRGCVAVDAKDQCGDPIPDVHFRLRGRDLGYTAETWTDDNGQACLEVALSEPIGMSYDYDVVQGETFFVDAELGWEGDNTTLPAIESPRTEGHCSQPETCLKLTHQLEDFTKDCE